MVKTTAGIGPPNLDRMPLSDVIGFFNLAVGNAADVARMIFPRRPRTGPHAVELLTGYAFGKALSILARRDGRFSEALVIEGHCEIIFLDIPRFARW